MRMGLLGAGQQGQACVLDWLRQADVTEVRVIDTNEEALAALRGRFPDPRVVTQRRDVGDARQLEEGLAGCAAVMSAVPYFLNLAVTRAAIATRVPMVDLGGNLVSDALAGRYKWSDEEVRWRLEGDYEIAKPLQTDVERLFLLAVEYAARFVAGMVQAERHGTLEGQIDVVLLGSGWRWHRVLTEGPPSAFE